MPDTTRPWSVIAVPVGDEVAVQVTLTGDDGTTVTVLTDPVGALALSRDATHAFYDAGRATFGGDVAPARVDLSEGDDPPPWPGGTGSARDRRRLLPRPARSGARSEGGPVGRDGGDLGSAADARLAVGGVRHDDRGDLDGGEGRGLRLQPRVVPPLDKSRAGVAVWVLVMLVVAVAAVLYVLARWPG